MDSSLPEWRSYFATIADSYDRLQPVLSPPYSKGLDMLVDLIPFDADDTFEFVDLGCGTAGPTVRVLEHFRHATGTCIDSEPEMLALAKRKLTPYSDRIEVREADITSCDIQPCDLVVSAKTFHHLPPAGLSELFARTAGALRPGGCFVLYDAMSVGPRWGASVRQQASRFRQRHLQDAVASGVATQQEIDARVEYKRAMKAAGQDIEYEHSAENMIDAMIDAGFAEVAVVWRMFADTILLAFTPAKDA
ncbi:MAG: class I SAM-dependent methyltransferase [Gemmatimonadetes bacterium]|nr:class I SAM-dependent methyltransferase [Gemmatimonadota bacterium]